MTESSVKSPLKAPPPPPRQGVAQIQASNKTFTLKRLSLDDVGKKVLLYSAPGGGKSSLASLAPSPIFIDLDNGAASLGVEAIQGITSFPDLRAAVQQYKTLVPEKGSLVIDTMTSVAILIEKHVLQSAGKHKIKELGYDRFSAMVEETRLLLSDLDAVMASGRNVVLVAWEQNAVYKNALGDDYRIIAPKLLHSISDSVRDEVVGWCDHVVRIAQADAEVAVEYDDKGKKKAGKITNASTTRYLMTDGTQAVTAKSREVKGGRLPSLIEFTGPKDNSFWLGLNDASIFNTKE